MHQVRTGDYTAVLVYVVLGRRFLSNFLTIYLPTILLNIVGHTTVYFKAGLHSAISIFKIYNSLVEPGAFAHYLKSQTARKIQNG